jgi:hypothetical protein
MQIPTAFMRAKITHKINKKVKSKETFLFWSLKCSLLLFKLSFFTIFSSKPWIQIRIRMDPDSHWNQFGSTQNTYTVPGTFYLKKGTNLIEEPVELLAAVLEAGVGGHWLVAAAWGRPARHLKILLAVAVALPAIWGRGQISCLSFLRSYEYMYVPRRRLWVMRTEDRGQEDGKIENSKYFSDRSDRCSFLELLFIFQYVVAADTVPPMY